MRRLIRKSVELDPSDIEWFESHYPEHSYSWVLGMLLHEFREQHTVTPQDLAKLGAEEMKRKLENAE